MTIISDLPQCLVEEILTRVPTSCVGDVRSTCKDWEALSRQVVLCKGKEANHRFLWFMMNKYKLCSVRFDFFNEEELLFPSLITNQMDISNIFYCDGLLLCVTRDHTRLFVWNPYLGQTRWIEPPRKTNYHRLDRFAIGYGHDDDNNRKHKILRFLDDDLENHVFGFDIYDFDSDSWRVLDITPAWDIEWYQRGVSLKGNTYFIAREKVIFPDGVGMVDEPHGYLLCFDFTRERFGEFLPLPFEHYVFDTGALFCLRDEKLAALYQCLDLYQVEIWVTKKIEQDAASWTPFLKIDMEPHTWFGFQFQYNGGSFIVDEEKKVAIVFHLEEESQVTKTLCYHTAYIIGEDGYLKRVGLVDKQESVMNLREYENCCPLVCSCSYIPSLVQSH